MSLRLYIAGAVFVYANCVTWSEDLMRQVALTAEVGWWERHILADCYSQ